MVTLLKLLKHWLFSFGLLASTVFMMLALISYSPYDSSLIYDTTQPTVIHNYMGPFGAQCAGLLFYVFGQSAFLIIYLFGMLTYSFFRYHTMRVLQFRALALIGLLCISSCIEYTYTLGVIKRIYPGGVCGVAGTYLLSKCLESWQVSLFLYTACLSLVVLIVQFSWISLWYPLGNYIASGRLFVWLQQLVVSCIEHIVAVKKVAKEWVYSGFYTQEKAVIYDDPFWDLFIHPAQQYKEEPKTAHIKAAASKKEALEDVVFEDEEVVFDVYRLPQLKMSAKDKAVRPERMGKDDSAQQARALEFKLEQFGIEGKVVHIMNGPVVTLFEYQPSATTKISTIIAREDDLALALQALSLRIIAPIPGKSVVGFEVAQIIRETVYFFQLAESKQLSEFKGELPLVLGKDTQGRDSIIDLASTPHLLVAGSTGSGKSVGLNSMLVSLLLTRTPDEVRLILIDPKRLEFAGYNDIAHLVFPVIVEPQRAILALKWALKTMEDRYTHMAKVGVRNIKEYKAIRVQKQLEPMPFIVIMIDELADLMITAGKEVEQLITRLAQMSRAAGIHLVIATQRPSVDVITGLIKANLPSRIAFKVASKIDSRTILDAQGAEKLLGRGDMLYLDSQGTLKRIHGAYVTDEEVTAVVNQVKKQRSTDYCSLETFGGHNVSQDVEDTLLPEIVAFAQQKDEISISLVQRVFKIGYNRSARIVDQLETKGYIFPANGSKMRKVNKTLLDR
ncbi:DNA translocase FtsK [Candidatus Dependentiae bacterium]|nr:DNA translocase FtsK [Candidatus Dependentiae bacterium]